MFDPTLAASLAQTLEEADDKLADLPGPWTAETGPCIGDIGVNRPGRNRIRLDEPTHAEGMAALKNHARQAAEQLRAACAEVESLRRGLAQSRDLLGMVRDDFDQAVAMHSTADPRHPSHGGQHHNGPCCEFGNVTPGAVRHMRRLRDAIDTALATTKKDGQE